MNEDLLEIREHNGRGFKPLITFGEWRVAILRFLDELQPERIDTMERHTETDEVFVLLSGRAVLIIGGNGAQVEGIYPQLMEPEKIYNVKCKTWHTILLSQDASMLLVENKDTGDLNTEYTRLSPEHRRRILEIAHHEEIGSKLFYPINQERN